MRVRVALSFLTAFAVALPLSMAVAASKPAPKKDGPPAVPAKLEDAQIVTAWTRAADRGDDTHVFITVENKGPSPIYVKGGIADVATAVQLMKFEILGATMRTVLVNPVMVDPQGRYVFEPGVVAIELRELKRSLQKGDRIPLKVVFAEIGEISVEAEVDSRSAVRYDEPPPDALGPKKAAH